MTTVAAPTGPSSTPSPRVQRVATAIRRAQARRVRRAALRIGLVLALLGGWHLIPQLRMKWLRGDIERIRDFRRAQGHYPLTEAELAAASRPDGSAAFLPVVKFRRALLPGMGVTYRPFENGLGFELRFNHHCFCESLDTSRDAYDSQDDSWCHGCD